MLARAGYDGHTTGQKATPVSHPSSVLLLMPPLLAIGIYLGYRHVMKAKALLQEWAQTNHFRIVRARLCIFMPWRIYFTTTKYQVVYQVSLYDESTHRIRAAWVRLGTRVWGVMDSGAVDVEWADADQTAPR
jgi:hypothetical protein